MQTENIYIGMEVCHEDNYLTIYTVIEIDGNTAECRTDLGSIKSFDISELYAIDA